MALKPSARVMFCPARERADAKGHSSPVAASDRRFMIHHIGHFIAVSLPAWAARPGPASAAMACLDEGLAVSATGTIASTVVVSA